MSSDDTSKTYEVNAKIMGGQLFPKVKCKCCGQKTLTTFYHLCQDCFEHAILWAAGQATKHRKD